MSDAPLDFDAYRHRIGFDGPSTPSLQTLAQLIERHAASIAFENIDVLAGRVPRLDLASLQHKLVQRRRGGYCFEQNGFLLAALKQLGFAAVGLEARVRAGVPADVITPRTHMALLVTLEGDDYLADVAFGGLAPVTPLKLPGTGVQHDADSAYRFVDAGGADKLLQCETHEGWTDCYLIHTSEPQPIDYEMANWFVATNPKAMLRHNLLVARSTQRGRLTLFNSKLSLRRSTAQPEETILSTRAEFADALADAFGLQIDTADLDAVMAVIEAKAALAPES